MIGPTLDLWRRQICFACRRDDLPVFLVDTARLRDCGQIYRLCRYCRDLLRARGGFAPDHWPWVSFMAFGEETDKARRADVAAHFGPGRAQDAEPGE